MRLYVEGEEEAGEIFIGIHYILYKYRPEPYRTQTSSSIFKILQIQMWE